MDIQTQPERCLNMAWHSRELSNLGIPPENSSLTLSGGPGENPRRYAIVFAQRGV